MSAITKPSLKVETNAYWFIGMSSPHHTFKRIEIKDSSLSEGMSFVAIFDGEVLNDPLRKELKGLGLRVSTAYCDTTDLALMQKLYAIISRELHIPPKLDKAILKAIKSGVFHPLTKYILRNPVPIYHKNVQKSAADLW